MVFDSLATSSCVNGALKNVATSSLDFAVHRCEYSHGLPMQLELGGSTLTPTDQDQDHHISQLLILNTPGAARRHYWIIGRRHALSLRVDWDVDDRYLGVSIGRIFETLKLPFRGTLEA